MTTLIVLSSIVAYFAAGTFVARKIFSSILGNRERSYSRGYVSRAATHASWAAIGSFLLWPLAIPAWIIFRTTDTEKQRSDIAREQKELNERTLKIEKAEKEIRNWDALHKTDSRVIGL